MNCGPVAFIVCIFNLTLFVHRNGQVKHSNRLSRGGVVDSVWFNRVQSLTDGFISCENTGGIRHRSVPPLVNLSVRLYVPLVPPYFYPHFSLYKDVKSAYLPHYGNKLWVAKSKVWLLIERVQFSHFWFRFLFNWGLLQKMIIHPATKVPKSA